MFFSSLKLHPVILYRWFGGEGEEKHVSIQHLARSRRSLYISLFHFLRLYPVQYLITALAFTSHFKCIYTTHFSYLKKLLGGAEVNISNSQTERLWTSVVSCWRSHGEAVTVMKQVGQRVPRLAVASLHLTITT